MSLPSSSHGLTLTIIAPYSGWARLDNEDGSVLEAAHHDWPLDKWLVRHSVMVIQQFVLSYIILETLILDIKTREKQSRRIRRREKRALKI